MFVWVGGSPRSRPPSANRVHWLLRRGRRPRRPARFAMAFSVNGGPSRTPAPTNVYRTLFAYVRRGVGTPPYGVLSAAFVGRHDHMPPRDTDAPPCGGAHGPRPTGSLGKRCVGAGLCPALGPLSEGAVEHKRDWGREFKIFILSLRRFAPPQLCTPQCAHWGASQREAKEADSHTSDLCHWFGMTRTG